MRYRLFDLQMEKFPKTDKIRGKLRRFGHEIRVTLKTFGAYLELTVSPLN